MTRKPSVNALRRVFGDAILARQILTMTHAELLDWSAGGEFNRRCLNPPSTCRMHCLESIEPRLYGVEYAASDAGEYAEYLNTGDTYADTVIYWRGRYRVQSLGAFVEAMERQGIKFP